MILWSEEGRQAMAIRKKKRKSLAEGDSRGGKTGYLPPAEAATEGIRKKHAHKGEAGNVDRLRCKEQEIKEGTANIRPM